MPNIKFGEIYMAKIYGIDHEQNGTRPCVIISNNIGNKHSPNVIVLPLSSSKKKIERKFPTHVLMKAQLNGLKYDSVVMCENPVTLSKKKLKYYMMTTNRRQRIKIAWCFIKATVASEINIKAA